MRSFSVKAFAYACSPSALHPFLKRIEASDIGLRMARGMFWVMVGTIISRALMLLATMLVARLLGKTGYGELGMIQSTIGMLGEFAGFGLGLTATKYVAEHQKSDPIRAGHILSLSSVVAIVAGGVMAIALLIFAPWLAAHTINAPHLTDHLRIGAIIIFFSAINGAQTGALSGFEKFKLIANVNLIVGVISFPVVFFWTLYGGLTGAVCALGMNLIIKWFLNHISLKMVLNQNMIYLNYKKCFIESPVLWRFSFPAALSGFVVGPAKWVCGALLVHQPGGYGEMGIYNAANQWTAIILFVPSLIAQVVIPILSSISGENNKKFITLVKSNIYINMLITLVFIIPIILFAQYIMLLYGKEFEIGKNVLRVTAISSLLISINGVIGSAIISKGKMWIGLIFNCVWSVILVLTCYLFISSGYKSMSLSLSVLVAYLVHTILQVLFLQKAKDISN